VGFSSAAVTASCQQGELHECANVSKACNLLGWASSMAAFGFALVVAVRWVRRFSSGLSLRCLSCLVALLRLLSLFKLNVDFERSRIWPGRSIAADIALLSTKVGNYETGLAINRLAEQGVDPVAIDVENGCAMVTACLGGPEKSRIVEISGLPGCRVQER
jgi:hypothetical protein